MKLLNKIMLVIFLGLICISLVSCKETTYTVEKRDFYYSLDNGSTYGNERYELEVGQTILMKVMVLIHGV